MTSNFSTISNAYNKYAAYGNYPQKEKNADTAAFKVENANDRKKFDIFTHDGEEENSGNICNLYGKDGKVHKNGKTECPDDCKLLGAFAEAAEGYDFATSKTDNFNYMIKSGKKSVIYIDKSFYESIKNDPEKIREYSEAIGNMKMIDKMVERQAKSQGKKIISKGWYIDKNGEISSWTITKKEKKVKRTQLEKSRDLQRDILLKRNKKKKEQKKIEEKRSREKEERLRLEGRKKAAMKEKFKRKANRCTIIDMNNLEIMRRSRQGMRNSRYIGLN